MQDYIAMWEHMSAQLGSIKAPIDERLLVSMFVESFGKTSISQFGTAVTTLLTLDNLTWKSVTARLLQEHISQQVWKSANNSTKTLAFASYTEKGYEKKKNSKKTDVMGIVVIIRPIASRERGTRRKTTRERIRSTGQ